MSTMSINALYFRHLYVSAAVKQRFTHALPAIAFDTSAQSWLNQQSQYELWHAEQRRKELKVKRLVAA
jgi:plasmid maintenance system antidote protein VapI